MELEVKKLCRGIPVPAEYLKELEEEAQFWIQALRRHHRKQHGSDDELLKAIDDARDASP